MFSLLSREQRQRQRPPRKRREECHYSHHSAIILLAFYLFVSVDSFENSCTPLHRPPPLEDVLATATVTTLETATPILSTTSSTAKMTPTMNGSSNNNPQNNKSVPHTHAHAHAHAHAHVHIHRKVKRAGMPLRNTAARSKIPRKRANFHDMIIRLQQFREKNGHSLVTDSDDEPELFRWTQSIRKNYRYQIMEGGDDDSVGRQEQEQNKPKRRKPRLSDEKMNLLSELEFCWDVKKVSWKKRYEELCSYQELYGDCRVPLNSDMYGFSGLGVWVQNQRREYRKHIQGQKSTLCKSRLKSLAKIGFFEGYQSHEDAWQQKYCELVEYFKLHDHSNVPQDYDLGNTALGKWCMNQRTARKRLEAGETTALTPERIQLLDDINFQWNIRESKWLSMLERLKEYHQENDHINISTLDENNRDLRIWLIVQRNHFNRRQQNQSSALTQERIDAIENAIPDFSWKARGTGNGPSADDWDQLFSAMREKGIRPGMRPKQHWFEGINPFESDVKDIWTAEDLMELWNQEDEENDDDW